MCCLCSAVREERFPEDVAVTNLYDRLQVLFKAIDQGNDELNVPTYNGGLFMTEVDANKAEEMLIPDERAARFLATYRIPNRDLTLGLDLMARDEDERLSMSSFFGINFEAREKRKKGAKRNAWKRAESSLPSHVCG